MAFVARAIVAVAFATVALASATASSSADSARDGGNRDDRPAGMADTGKTVVVSFHTDFAAPVKSSEAYSRVQADN